MKTRRCMGLSVDVDRFSDRDMVKNYTGVLKHPDGRYVQVPQELRKLCAEYRAKGYESVPPCDNVNERGYCRGHEDEPPAVAESDLGATAREMSDVDIAAALDAELLRLKPGPLYELVASAVERLRGEHR